MRDCDQEDSRTSHCDRKLAAQAQSRLGNRSGQPVKLAGGGGDTQGPLACNAPIKQTAGRGLRLRLPESSSESAKSPSVITSVGAEPRGGPAEVRLLRLLGGLASLDSGEWPRLALPEVLLRRTPLPAMRRACSNPPGGARFAGMPAYSPCACMDTVTSQKLVCRADLSREPRRQGGCWDGRNPIPDSRSPGSD